MSNKDLARVVLHMSAEVGQLRKDFAKANSIAGDSARKMEAASAKAASNMEKRMAAATKNMGAGFSDMRSTVMGVFAAIAGSQGARAVMAASQQFTAMQNALKATGLEGKALDTAFKGLYQIAQKNGTEMAPLVTLYSRMSMAQKELNASSGDMMKFSEAVSLALKVQGTSTQEASGALLQLSQAMGGGKVQAEEYNSLIDQAPMLLKAVAAGMEETGGSVSELTKLVKDGQISSEAFFRAGIAGMPVLEQASAKMAGTVDQSIQMAKNAFTVLIGELDNTTGASANAAQNLAGVAAAIEKIPQYIDAAAKSLSYLQTWLNQVGNNPFWRKLGELAGADYSAEGMRKNGIIPMNSPMTNRVGDSWEINQTARGGSFTNHANMSYGPQLPPPEKVSYKKYAVKGDEKGGKAKGGGGGGKSDEETRADQVARYIEQLERSGRVLQAEFDSIGKSNAERAKAIELARIGTVTDQGQLAAIDKQVTANEKLRTAIEDAKRSQKGLQDVAQFAGDQIMNVFDDLIDGSGNLADSIKNIAKSLASAALQAALLGNGPLGNIFGTGGKDGGLGGLLGSLVGGVTKKADGGWISGPGGPRSDKVPALLSNGEFVVNAKAAGQHGQLLQAINSGRVPRFANGGPVGVSLPSPSSLRRSGGAAPVVNINNHTGQQVSQSTGPNGEVNIDIGAAVDAALAQRMGGSGRGMTARLMRAQASRAHLRG